MKKFVSMLLALVMVFALCACGSKTEDGNKDAASIKVGFICLHDENSTYDKNFIDAAKAACKNAGLTEVTIVGFDGNASALDLIKAGDDYVKATVAQQPTSMGYEAVMAAYKTLQGETVDEVIPAPVKVIDASNVNG